ncbi:tetratricopeptide repeat protein [Bowmanella sp. Y26]|uniref:alpha/beta hydrolase-fold protein n=1 Tax=Bowmanella yangjiangensis TaxID=2811230 RepID=UPI001BDC9DB1|nr:alpha/beta hydrolase-fold protein [Bowmanella yangjiangensis]MBT1065609.1 tetratricopeptide repeat protein [Bowmanella yangjiangensis]
MIKLICAITLVILAHIGNVNATPRGTSKIDSLYSDILLEQRDLLIYIPSGYYQNEHLNYPVLYLTDGLRNFNHALGTLDLLTQSHMANEMIIVAIKNTNRTKDFTPTYDESYNQWGISGGADNFLDFMQKELIPHINKNYRTTGFKVLSGHSLGGLLTVYSLQTRPDLFQAHFAFSPSLWWHQSVIFRDAEKFHKKTSELNNYLYLNLADEGGDMLSSFEKYKELLHKNKRFGFSYHADLIENENHNTTSMVGHNKAYRNLYEKLKCPQDVIDKGIAAITQCYNMLSKKYGTEINPEYSVYRQAAKIHFNNKEYNEAVKVLESIARLFPNVSDAHFRLSYAYEANGEDKKALEAVTKALEISATENVENNSYKTFRAHILNKLHDN